MNVIARQKPKPTISAEEMERRREAVRRAYAHNRIEGLSSTPAYDAVYESFVRGDFELSELRDRLRAADNRL